MLSVMITMLLSSISSGALFKSTRKTISRHADQTRESRITKCGWPTAIPIKGDKVSRMSSFVKATTFYQCIMLTSASRKCGVNHSVCEKARSSTSKISYLYSLFPRHHERSYCNCTEGANSWPKSLECGARRWLACFWGSSSSLHGHKICLRHDEF